MSSATALHRCVKSVMKFSFRWILGVTDIVGICHWHRVSAVLNCTKFNFNFWLSLHLITGYCIYYPKPPAKDFTFSSYPWKLSKIALTPADVNKLWFLPLKNTSLPTKNFVKIKASPLKNSISFYSTPKENPNFYNLPSRIKWVLIRGRGCGGYRF